MKLSLANFFKFFLLALASLSCFVKICAQAGTLDPGFGTDGKSVISINTGDYATSSVVQPDDKIIIAGGTSIIGNPVSDSFAIVRYQADGKPDSTFGTNAKVTTGVGLLSYIRRIVLQSDGKILAVGNSYNPSLYQWSFAVARYSTSGALDSTFGTNGLVITSFPQNNAYLDGAALQSDGKLVCGGRIENTFSLIRYDANGSIDSTFGVDGIQKFNPFPSFYVESAYTLTVQPDDKIIALSGYNEKSANGIFLARFKPDGNFDSSFGDIGYVRTTIIDSLSYFLSGGTDIKLQDDGKLVVGGYVHTKTTEDDFALLRYQPNGNLDSSFGINGKVITDFYGKRDIGTSVLIQADTKILIAGNVGQSDQRGFNAFGMARYYSNGNLDSSFGTNGKLVTYVGVLDDYTCTLNFQSDRKIILAGYIQSDSLLGNGFTALRYNNDNSLLPISVLSFTASPSAKSVLLKWQTAGVANGQSYFIQRSSDNRNWKSIGWVNGKISSLLNAYFFEDFQPLTGFNYYRLQEVVEGGKVEYSKTLSVEIALPTLISLSPNPVIDVLRIYNLDNSSSFIIQIFTEDGKMTGASKLQTNNATIDVKSLAKGVYYVRIIQEKIIKTLKFIKQ